MYRTIRIFVFCILTYGILLQSDTVSAEIPCGNPIAYKDAYESAEHVILAKLNFKNLERIPVTVAEMELHGTVTSPKREGIDLIIPFNVIKTYKGTKMNSNKIRLQDKFCYSEVSGFQPDSVQEYQILFLRSHTTQAEYMLNAGYGAWGIPVEDGIIKTYKKSYTPEQFVKQLK